MFGLFSSIRLMTAESSTSLSELDQTTSLKDTLDGLNALLDDDLVGIFPPLAISDGFSRGEDPGKWIECVS